MKIFVILRLLLIITMIDCVICKAIEVLRTTTTTIDNNSIRKVSGKNHTTTLNATNNVKYNKNALNKKQNENRKRCRYTSVDDEFDSNKALDTSQSSSGLLIKQLRTRDQNILSGFFHSNDDMDVVYASNGDLVNLTCIIHTKEIDWHFKDKNSITNIISYGPSLQIYKHIPISKQVIAPNGDTITSRKPQWKYRVNSDTHSNHILSVYIQGKQDEGTYQCVDSKSDQPIKKTIKLILRNNANSLITNNLLLTSLMFIYFICKNKIQ